MPAHHPIPPRPKVQKISGEIAGPKPSPGELVCYHGSDTVFRLKNHEAAARAAFVSRQEELKTALLAATDVPPEVREPVEWRFVAYQKLRDARVAVSKGEPVDSVAIRSAVASHIAKYPDVRGTSSYARSFMSL